MIEKVITIYEEGEIVALLFLQEIDLEYIDKKLVVYCKEEIKDEIRRLEDIISCGYISISTLRKKLSMVLEIDVKRKDMTISSAIEFESNNKNKSSRDKRLLESIGDKKSFERLVINIGEKDIRHLRKR